MNTSILDSIKKVLGMDPGYTAFDIDIIMHINTVFSTLHQIGIGPVDGFFITDATSKWENFVGTSKNIASVQTYVALRVRLIFDPPATSFVIAAYEKLITELEWRLNVVAEGVSHPYVPVVLGVIE